MEGEGWRREERGEEMLRTPYGKLLATPLCGAEYGPDPLRGLINVMLTLGGKINLFWGT